MLLLKKLKKGYLMAVFPLVRLFSTLMGLCSEKDETGVSRMTILHCMEKQMLSGMQEDNDPMQISLWLQRWHHAGTAAD